MKYMPIIARGFVNQEQLREEVQQAVTALDPREVRDVDYRLGTDYSGEPAIFFGILLTPEAVKNPRGRDLGTRVTSTLFDRIQPYNRWGLQSYFNFTSNPALYRDPLWNM